MDEVKTTETPEISEEYLAAFRGYVRITTAKTKLDGELCDLIRAARADLVRVGILPERVKDESDPLIKRAISAYVKGEFGLDNEDADAYRVSYQMQRAELSMASEYIGAGEGKGA